MLLKRPKHRTFDYQPRYFDPEKDPTQKFRQKMQAERRSHKGKKRPVLLWAFLFLLVIYVYLYLSGVLR